MKFNYKRVFLIILVLIFLYVIYINYSIESFENKNYMDGADVIYWINLDRAAERRIDMENLLSSETFNNIPNYRISATDGKTPENIDNKLNKYTKQDRSNYEYGCLLSHLGAINEFSKSNYENALIMEDDITLDFKKYWQKSIREIINDAPSDWDIIILLYFRDGKFIENEFEKYTDNYDGTLVYLINNSAAKKFISSQVENDKYNLNDDKIHVSDRYIYQSMNTYLYKYPMFIFKTNNDSDIHAQHLQYQNNIKNDYINNYNTIFPNIQ